MNWIEEVRKVLKAHDAWMRYIYPPDIFTGVSGDEGALAVIELRKQAEEALAAIPDEPEMVRLLGWLDRQRAWGSIGKVRLLQRIIRHIEDEFGYKLEDESEVMIKDYNQLWRS